ncbi:sugar transferase [Candidatus Atribacteria bacterium HGW-Atribacteria-1]|nr:MAG: sugar transferase [Candidatus Atribacteria bacterium HGW-Atribacteria-1]
MKTNKKQVGFVLKRFFDILASGIALIVLLPIFAVTGIFIKLDSKGPVFFIQERAGKDGKIFRAYKLRTMVQGAGKKTKGIVFGKDNPYITKVGKFIRRTGFDELVQLINVLRGDMSLVGPRPTLPYQIKKYNNIQKGRLSVRPGITGWALINGRNSLTWDKRIELDLWYIKHWSIWLDIKILIYTIYVVIKGEGLYAEKGRKDKIVESN